MGFGTTLAHESQTCGSLDQIVDLAAGAPQLITRVGRAWALGLGAGVGLMLHQQDRDEWLLSLGHGLVPIKWRALRPEGLSYDSCGSGSMRHLVEIGCTCESRSVPQDSELMAHERYTCASSHQTVGRADRGSELSIMWV